MLKFNLGPRNKTKEIAVGIAVGIVGIAVGIVGIAVGIDVE